MNFAQRRKYEGELLYLLLYEMNESEQISTVNRVPAEYISIPGYKTLYKAVCRLIAEGTKPSILTVYEYLKRMHLPEPMRRYFAAVMSALYHRKNNIDLETVIDTLETEYIKRIYEGTLPNVPETASTHKLNKQS